MSAVELGTLTVGCNGAGTLAEVAAATSIHATNADGLIVMLCAADLMQVWNGRLQNAPVVERFLVEGQPDFMGPWITITKP